MRFILPLALAYPLMAIAADGASVSEICPAEMQDYLNKPVGSAEYHEAREKFYCCLTFAREREIDRPLIWRHPLSTHECLKYEGEAEALRESD